MRGAINYNQDGKIHVFNAYQTTHYGHFKRHA